MEKDKASSNIISIQLLLRFILSKYGLSVFRNGDFNTTLVKVHRLLLKLNMRSLQNFNTTLVKVHQNSETILGAAEDNFNTTLVKVHRSVRWKRPACRPNFNTTLVKVHHELFDGFIKLLYLFQYNSC